MISVHGLTKTFDLRDGVVLDRLHFDLDRGETLAVIGPSGCGKTTLLYILAGLMAPSDGRVSIGGRFGADTKGRTAFILQDFGLFPWKTTAENIALGLQLKAVPARRRQTRTEALMDQMGLSGLGARYPVQLSGGQKQRVAIARALATDPDLILMDEPFSSLDALTREHLQNVLLELWRHNGVSFIIVTHSVEEAVFLGRRVAVLTDRPTRIRTLIDNPAFDRRDARLDSGFSDKVREVRRAMEA